jgi:hypothetical protein
VLPVVLEKKCEERVNYTSRKRNAIEIINSKVQMYSSNSQQQQQAAALAAEQAKLAKSRDKVAAHLAALAN